MKKTFKCRLVKVRDEQGNLQVLCTSLLDPAKYKIEELADLYKLRWGIEEGYKMVSHR
jgi:IS4 transposase